MPRLVKLRADDVGHVGVDAGEDLGQPLEHGDLARRGRPCIEANSQPMAPPPMTAADAGQVGHRQHLVGGEHEAPVDVEAGDRAGHRARGEDHGVALEGLDRAVLGGDLDRAAAPVDPGADRRS